MLRPPLLLAFAVLLLLACNREKDLRNKECADWADWSNHAGDPLANAVPEAEKSAAVSNEARAAMYRKLAEGARKAAKGPVPFTDPFVRSLAERRLKTLDARALILDREADAWAKGDRDGAMKAMGEEMDASVEKAISDDWMNHCRL